VLVAVSITLATPAHADPTLPPRPVDYAYLDELTSLGVQGVRGDQDTWLGYGAIVCTARSFGFTTNDQVEQFMHEHARLLPSHDPVPLDLAHKIRQAVDASPGFCD
jgi:hypothetical protein